MLPNPTLQRYIRPAPFVVTHVKPSEGDVAGLSDVKPSSGPRGARAPGERPARPDHASETHVPRGHSTLSAFCQRKHSEKGKKKQLSRSRNSAREVRFAAENRSEGREKLLEIQVQREIQKFRVAARCPLTRRSQSLSLSLTHMCAHARHRGQRPRSTSRSRCHLALFQVTSGGRMCPEPRFSRLSHTAAAASTSRRLVHRKENGHAASAEGRVCRLA